MRPTVDGACRNLDSARNCSSYPFRRSGREVPAIEVDSLVSNWLGDCSLPWGIGESLGFARSVDVATGDTT